MTNVYFATNRVHDGTAPFGYGHQVAPPTAANVTFAVASVSGIALPDETSGHIDSITQATPGNFPADILDVLANSRKTLLVFIHGFDNSFEDAIKRAAFNREWLAAGGADTEVIAFTWPSAGELFAAPPHTPPDAYFADQSRAGRSAFALAHFLTVIDQIRAGYRTANPNGRIVLLVHSMGHYALQAAVQFWFASTPPKAAFFDEILLAAGDEIADTFERPNGGHLSDLPKIATRISVYNSECDVAMYLSTTLNLDQRLGFDGPLHKHDASRYPPATFRTVDCTAVADYDPLNPPDASHQYYRRSKLVRSDLVGAIQKNPALPDGLSTLPPH
jgi:esterase/lipase superfamily enzyme